MPDVDELLAALTLEEKVALLAGADLWHTVAVPRLGIPALRVTDGPNGARGTRFSGGPPSALFPCAVSLAASFDVGLVREVGVALAAECVAKGAGVLLAPTVNLHRTPVGGRNFECFSEDPYLTARLAVAYVTGLQEHGVAACIKHFVANDTEFERMTISSEVDERTLREVYLRPFETAVREAGVRAVMASYNRVNGTYAADHRPLLADVLRGEWGFDGLVMSDWYGLRSTADGLAAGTDLEMPGPTQRRGEKLLAALAAGEAAEADVDASARRVLDLMRWTGALDGSGPAEETTRYDEGTAALIRRAGAAGTVLLRNEGAVLPIEAGHVRSVAVLGQYARHGAHHGGGSAALRPERRVSLLVALRERLPEVRHEVGCRSYPQLPPLDDVVATTPDGEPGVRLVFLDADGTELARETADRAHFWFDGVPHGARRIRLEARVAADEPGAWTLGLVSTGPAWLTVDGEVAVDNRNPQRGRAFFGLGSREVQSHVALAPGAEIVVHFEPSMAMAGITVGCLQPLPDDAMERAAAAAGAADVAVVVVGTGEGYESEGSDRPDMALPGDQDELVRRAAAANPRTVVVVNAASPVDMPWADEVAAVLQVWFPGQELGGAVADVLLGAVDPGGRLPVTIPRRLQDTPAYLHHPGEGGVARYAEGPFLGYRWYDARDIAPRYPFGFGLSYTQFAHGEPVLDGDGDAVLVPVTNVGHRAGKEVVQVYVHPPAGPPRRPVQVLAGFAAVELAAGEARTVRVPLDPRAFEVWDPAAGGWVTPPGEYELRVGRSSRDVRARLAVRRGSAEGVEVDAAGDAAQ